MKAAFYYLTSISSALLLQAGAAAESSQPAHSNAPPAAQADVSSGPAQGTGSGKAAAPDPRASAGVWCLSVGHILSSCGTGDITYRATAGPGSGSAGEPAAGDACETPLHEAAFQGRGDEVRRLQESGADPNARSFTGETPLHLAALAGRADVVRLLLDEGADPMADSSRGTPLHRAAEGGAAEAAKLLLAAGASVKARVTGGETPLHTAARMGQAETARLLLEHGADPNADNSAGNTPLHLAAEFRSPATAALLLAHGAAVNARNRAGETPLLRVRDEETARLLLAHGANPTLRSAKGATPLHQAASAGLPELAHVLIERGAKVNQKDDYGQTTLHCAAENACGAESCRLAALLLEYGADVNARAKYRDPGRTALECAVLGGRTELVRLLLEHGADAAENEPKRDSLLLMAVLGKAGDPAPGSPELVRLLLEHGARVNPAESGMLLCWSRSSETMRLLIEHGAKVRARGEFGGGTLHDAVYLHRPERVRLLLEHGADPNVRDDERDTPLHLAAAYKDTVLAEILLAAGADVNARNGEGDTPLSLAERAGATDTAALLRARGAKETSAAAKVAQDEGAGMPGAAPEEACADTAPEVGKWVEPEDVGEQEDVGDVIEAYPGAKELYGTDSYAHLKQAVTVRVCWQWSREDTSIPLPSACVCLEGSEARFFIDSLLRHAVYHPESYGRLIPVDKDDDYYCDDGCTDQYPELIFYDAAGRSVCRLDWIDFYPPLEGKYPNLFALPPSVFSALDALIIRRLPSARAGGAYRQRYGGSNFQDIPSKQS